MSSPENFDFEADLNALLGLGGTATTTSEANEPAEATTPTEQPEPRETASGLPEPDLVALLDPTQTAPESVVRAVQADDFNVSQASATQADTPAAEPEAIARIREIAELRAQLLAQIGDAKRRGVKHDDPRLYVLHLRWFNARWEAIEAARGAGLIPRPPSPLPSNWTVPDPFQLLEGCHP